MLSSQGSLVSGAGAEPQPSKALGMLHLGSRDVTEHPGLNHAPGLCSSSYPQPPTQPWTHPTGDGLGLELWQPLPLRLPVSVICPLQSSARPNFPKHTDCRPLLTAGSLSPWPDIKGLPQYDIFLMDRPYFFLYSTPSTSPEQAGLTPCCEHAKLTPASSIAPTWKVFPSPLPAPPDLELLEHMGGTSGNCDF